MKEKSIIKVRRYLKGKIASDSCRCCSRDCLVVIDGVCLRCMKLIILYLKNQFAPGSSKNNGRFRIRERPSVKFSPVTFTKEELREMKSGAKPILKKEVERSPSNLPQRGFAWIDT